MKIRDWKITGGNQNQSLVIREALKEEGNPKLSSEGGVDFSLGKRWLLGRRTCMARGIPPKIVSAPYTPCMISLLLYLSPPLV